MILITLLFGALIGCWYAYQQKKNSQKHLHRMMKDMESLHKAELALEDLQVCYFIFLSILPISIGSFIFNFINIMIYDFLQKELERARMEQESVTTEKQNLEKRLQDESVGLHASYSDLEVSQLKAEIEVNIFLYILIFYIIYFF